MLFSSNAAPASPVSLSRSGFRFEPLEGRCLLSVSQPVDLASSLVAEVETGQDTLVHFSLLAGPMIESPRKGVSVEMVGTRSGEKPDLATDGTSLPLTDAVTTAEVFAPLPVAVPPDESIDPFVDCPGLDEDFCLPDKIELEFKIDDEPRALDDTLCVELNSNIIVDASTVSPPVTPLAVHRIDSLFAISSATNASTPSHFSWQ